MWDVIVVGARAAGAATALRFARSGRSVLLLDKATVGSDTLSTHILVPPAVAQLAALGLLQQVEAVSSPRVHQTLFEYCGTTRANPFPEPPHYMINVRRTILDPILIRAAQDAGAELRSQVHVESLIWEEDRVAGVRAQDASGATIEERARLVIGADGRHSLVARLTEPEEYNVMAPTTGALYAYFEGVGPAGTDDAGAGAPVLQVAFGPECTVMCSPTDSGLHVLLLMVSNEEFDRMHASDVAGYEARLRTVPALAPRLAGARLASKLHPAGPREVRGYMRRPFGPGWALVGDAGAVPHPALGHGIADALRSAELLHQHVEAAWAAGQPAEAQLARYQQARDAENTFPYMMSYKLSQIDAWRDPQVAAMLSGQLRPPAPAGARSLSRA